MMAKDENDRRISLHLNGSRGIMDILKEMSILIKSKLMNFLRNVKNIF